MAAMMPSASTSNAVYDNDAVERDLIDPDDATLDDLDDPLQGTSDRAPLTGRIASGGANTQSYLTSSIPGEDRRAPTNTIDETVWEDAVARPPGHLGEDEAGAVPQVPARRHDAAGRRHRSGRARRAAAGRHERRPARLGPVGAPHLLPAAQSVPVARGKGRAEGPGLLGHLRHGVDWRGCRDAADQATRRKHCLLPVYLDYWLHAFPTRHCLAAQCSWHTDDRQDTSLSCARGMVDRRTSHGTLPQTFTPSPNTPASETATMSSSEQHEPVPKAAEAAASPARSDKSSDSEGRPVREKFQKTSIDATANPISVLAEMTGDNANGTLKPGSRSASGSDSDRGRLRRKRSREDLDEDNEGEKQPDKKQERLEKTAEKPERHARKRSRDLTKDLEGGALAKPATTPVSRIEEADAEMASPKKDTAKFTSAETRTGNSPKNKRPRDETEGAETVEENTKDLSTNGQATIKAGDERESKRARDKEEAKPATAIPAGSGFANTSTASPFAAMAAKPAPPKTSDKTEALPQTSDDKFKASGFGSLANSSASPFGSFGAAGKAGSPFGGAKLSSFASPAATSSTSTSSSASGFGSLGGAKSAFGGSSILGGASSSPFGGSFALKPSGSASFATPGAAGITGLSSKPERAFGAPGDKVEDDGSDQEDDGDDDSDRDPEEGGRTSHSLSGAAPTETGEEHEHSAWVGRAKLYTMDGEGKERGWKERGVGNIKLNVTEDEPKKARFVLRADGTHRLLLNAAVTKTLVFGADSEGAKPKDGRLLFNSPNADGNLDMHLLKLKSERAVELWEHVAQVQKDEL
ncbi:hypothetical protein OPT61_g6641 [Boeremia exigua]|uniref:Uncharacterized protein n=1 Tax=Boeremia exigua TaxID=749465 RepID=A0ACC2I5T6_9PLEO|nr:hypothetical protein OPT61_g6641 [Boeremia exigua]